MVIYKLPIRGGMLWTVSPLLRRVSNISENAFAYSLLPRRRCHGILWVVSFRVVCRGHVHAVYKMHLWCHGCSRHRATLGSSATSLVHLLEFNKVTESVVFSVPHFYKVENIDLKLKNTRTPRSNDIKVVTPRREAIRLKKKSLHQRVSILRLVSKTVLRFNFLLINCHCWVRRMPPTDWRTAALNLMTSAAKCSREAATRSDSDRQSRTAVSECCICIWKTVSLARYI